MHCPNCQYEYEDWATTCSDCGAALTPGGPPDPAPAAPRFSEEDLRDWTVLTNVPNALLGNVLKDQLDQAGIPVIMKRSWGSDIAEFSHNDWVQQDLYVPRRFLDQARQVQYGTPDNGPLWAMPPAWTAPDDALDLAPPVDPSAPDPAPPPGVLLNLSQHQARLDERKHHRAAPPTTPRIVEFPQAAAPPVAPPAWPAPPVAAPVLPRYDPEPDWPPVRRRPPLLESRVYRFLMGLLLLAWLLPVLLQLLQAFGERWLSWLH